MSIYSGLLIEGDEELVCSLHSKREVAFKNDFSFYWIYKSYL